MGLDMNLSASKTLYPKWEDQEYKETEEMRGVRNAVKGMYKGTTFDHITVEFDVGYWRKANQIHHWFVENVQGGKDDCNQYPVAREQLEALLVSVRTVLGSSTLVEGTVTNGYRYENGERIPMEEQGRVMADSTIAEAVLPTHEGFFFGGYEYDQWYYEELEETERILNKCLELDEDWEFSYSSSW